jgi:uncharacterized protein
MSLITKDLISALRGQFRLDWEGIHGAPHWERVRANGLRLAAQTGANSRVVEYFAFLHDTQRFNDGSDPGHGGRAADFAATIMGRHVLLTDPELALLQEACRGHSDGLMEADITVMTCWDADRLDLGRVGITPDPDRLCTPAARDPATLDWAFERSLRG